jgi:hypothetical protein
MPQINASRPLINNHRNQVGIAWPQEPSRATAEFAPGRRQNLPKTSREFRSDRETCIPLGPDDDDALAGELDDDDEDAGAKKSSSGEQRSGLEYDHWLPRPPHVK